MSGAGRKVIPAFAARNRTGGTIASFEPAAGGYHFRKTGWRGNREPWDDHANFRPPGSRNLVPHRIRAFLLPSHGRFDKA
jgi:hypothetical protein